MVGDCEERSVGEESFVSRAILRTGEACELTVFVGSFLFMAPPPPPRSYMRRLGMTFRTIRLRTLFLVDRGVINRHDRVQRVRLGGMRDWTGAWKTAKVE